MTKKLYYEDSYKEAFEGTVLDVAPYKEGYAVVLDQTAFYPEGGGQPADCGQLGGRTVTHVFIKDETIYHVLDEALEVGMKVKGIIDFERRLDYMQQHSGEHIVSGLVNKLYGYNNVGFHLSDDYMTADFDGELTKEQLLEIEIRSNEAIFMNLPIVCELFTPEVVKERAYRSKIDIIGKVRLVEVPHYDTCACCGTHVGRTGEIGSIKIVGADRHRGGMRLTILCGRRALKDTIEKQEIVAKIGALLSSKPEQIINNFQKVQEELSTAKQKLALVNQELFDYKARGKAEGAQAPLCILEEGLTGDELRKYCINLTKYTSEICLVLTGTADDYKYALGAKNEDIRELAKALNATFDGRGGGAASLCQGSLRGTFEEIESFIKI